MKQSDGPDCSTGSKYSDFKMFLVINVTFFLLSGTELFMSHFHALSLQVAASDEM